MYPGLNEADCQVAAFRYRQLVAEGQQQQVVANVRPETGDTRSVLTTIQQRLGTLLVRTGHHLQGAHSVTAQRPDTVATEEPAAIA